MVAFDPQGSTAALNAAGYMDTPAGRASYTQDTGATSYPASSTVQFDSSGRIIQNNPPKNNNNNNNSGDNGGAAISAFLQSLASGNKAQFDEAVREFNATFGLDQQKFQEAVNEYQQTFGLNQAQVTGTYQGQPTLAAQNQAFQNAVAAAGLTGYFNAPGSAAGNAAAGPSQDQYITARTAQLQQIANMSADQAAQTALSEWNQGLAKSGNVAGGLPSGISFNAPTAAGAQQGMPTLANLAQQANFLGTYNGQPTLQAQLQNANLSGTFNGMPTLDALKTAASLQANPFAQAQVLYGLGNQAQNAANGSGGHLPGFQAPSGSAAVTATLPWLSSQANPGSYTQQQTQNWLANTPAPNQVNWTNLASSPFASNLTVQALSQKWGLDPNVVQDIAKSTMPQFAPPTLAGSTKF